MTYQGIRERFKARGIKATPQRAAIYKALLETTSHPSAEDLYKKISRRYPMISFNTVYSTLTVLRERGLVREVNVGREPTHFDANLAPHHHAVCLRCRSISDVMEGGQDRLESPRDLPEGFCVVECQVHFLGVCRVCRAKDRASRDRGKDGLA